MKKIALDPRTKDLISGLINSGAVGAGVGAAGMGAANLFTNRKNTDSEGKNKSLLKSMLLGGALGGATGAGGRAIWDMFDPAVAADPSSGVGRIADSFSGNEQGPPPPAEPGALELTKNVASGYPKLTGTGVGAGVGITSVLGRIKANKMFEKMKPAQISALSPGSKKLYDYLQLPTPMDRLSKFPMMHPITRAGLAGGATYGISKFLHGAEHDKLNYERNNDVNTLREKFSK